MTTVLYTISVAEAAEQLNMPVSTIRHLISTRRIPYVKLGGSVRLKPADLASWIDANTRPALPTRAR